MGWGRIFHQKLTIHPQIAYSISFFGRDNELQICHANFLVMDNKHGKSFFIKH